MNPDDPFEPLEDDEEELNPYAAPKADIRRGRGKADDDDERIRRQYLSHEASVKSVGYLCGLGALLSLIYMSLMIASLLGIGPALLNKGQGLPTLVFVALTIYFFGQAVLNVALAYGLIKLQNWARWTALALTSLGTLALLMVTILGASTMNNPGQSAGMFCPLIISAYIVYLLATPKSGVVCSEEYKDIIARTPHIKYKTSIVIWIFLGLVVFLIVVGVIGAIVSRFRQ